MFTAAPEATDLTGVYVLKHGNLFLLSDAAGDARPGHGLGLYANDTRVLSTYELLLDGDQPTVLLAAPAAAARATIGLTNAGASGLPGGSIGIERERFIDGALAERISLHNYGPKVAEVTLGLRLGADFADIFEVRGLARDQRGEQLPLESAGDLVSFGYRGLDGRTYRTSVRTVPAGRVVEADPGAAALDWRLSIATGGDALIALTVWPEVATAAERRPHRPPPVADSAAVDRAYADWHAAAAVVETSHAATSAALARALDDLRLLVNEGPGAGERYIGAGVPWYSCVFGRDSLIASRQLLPINSTVARDTLRVLAARQATSTDAWCDAQPGKILHELRLGELATAGVVPFGPYYGTIDATPLWLMLLDDYHRWTADDDLVDELWPNALAALEWIERDGDIDGDGFVEYQRSSERGLDNQGWKDSWDAIRHRDGTLARGPIALVEVQAYVHAARRAIARLAARRGETELAKRQTRAAEELRRGIETTFWMADEGTYALALDGHKRQVAAVASNAAHLLWTGTCTPERAASVATVLTLADNWTGWGIRTLSEATGGYDPLSYHCGSVWPHDNAIAVAGFARYGLTEAAARVSGGLLEAAAAFPEARLPELFGGQARGNAARPVPYPVACSPQAWAAGAIFELVGQMLGLVPDAPAQRLVVRPALPEWLPDLHISRLRVGDAQIDLGVRRQAGEFAVDVQRHAGELEVIVNG